MFETAKNLKDNGIFFLNTFTTLRGRSCWVCAINLSSEPVYLPEGFQVGKISSASLDVSHFIQQVNIDEIKIGSTVQQKVENNIEHLMEVKIRGRNEKETKRIQNLLNRFADIFAKDDFDLGHMVEVKHKIVLTDMMPFDNPTDVYLHCTWQKYKNI